MGARYAIQPRDFGPKLRITAAALGCDSQKALAAAFRAAKADTAFDVGRSYKWMQGRALPRAGSLYAEWAVLLDTGHDAVFLAGCDLDTFLALVAARHGTTATALATAAGLHATGAPAPPAPARVHPEGFLRGVYALYVAAQSPLYAGRLLRGSLVIADAPRGGGLEATMVQTFAGQRASFAGPLCAVQHGIALTLESPGGAFAPVFCGLFRPSPPAALLAGVICSFVALHPGVQPPYAAPVVMLRIPGATPAGIEATNRYLAVGEDPGADLSALGLMVERMPEFGSMLAAALRGPGWLRPEDHARLATAADRLWLAAAERAAPA